MKPFKKRKPTVSLCMIVKNEERYLRECLESVRDVVDEVILVDTGSTDSTLEIAKEFQAKIFEHIWEDDFAAARNSAIQRATGDWIFQIDADERLDGASKANFKKWIKNRKDACVSVLIDSPSEGRKNGGHFSRAHRLFRNHSNIKYSGRIHEQVSPSVRAIGGTEGVSNILLHHLGYAKSEGEMQEKSERNRLLLEKQVEEEPQNAYWHFTLAQNLILTQKYAQALKSLEFALKIGGLPKDIVCTALNNLAEIHLKKEAYKKAVEFAERSLKLEPKQLTARLMLFQIYEKTGNKEKQVFCLEAAIKLKKSSDATAVATEAYVEEEDLLVMLGLRYLALKRFEEAQRTLTAVLEINPENLFALKGIGDCFLNTGNFDAAVSNFRKAAQFNSGDLEVTEKLGWLAIKQKDFPAAIRCYEKLLTVSPSNPDLLKRLAGLHKVSGNEQKARALLLAVER